MTAIKPGIRPSSISASLLALVGNQNSDVRVVGDEPLPFSPVPPEEEEHRFIEIHEFNGDLWCIREKYAEGQVTSALVAVSERGVRMLGEAQQFYAHPRILSDGAKLAWICLENPQMPWDGTEIKVAVIQDWQLIAPTVVAGNLEESCLNPEWGLDDELFFYQ